MIATLALIAALGALVCALVVAVEILVAVALTGPRRSGGAR